LKPLLTNNKLHLKVLYHLDILDKRLYKDLYELYNIVINYGHIIYDKIQDETIKIIFKSIKQYGEQKDIKRLARLGIFKYTYKDLLFLKPKKIKKEP